MVNPHCNVRQEDGNDLDQQDPDQNLDNGQSPHQVLAMQTQLMQTVLQASPPCSSSSSSSRCLHHLSARIGW
jgi:hypothetical protein